MVASSSWSLGLLNWSCFQSISASKEKLGLVPRSKLPSHLKMKKTA